MKTNKALVVLAVAMMSSSYACADEYTKKPGPQNNFSAATTLQLCSMKPSGMGCSQPGALNGTFTSASAKEALESLRCTYKYSRATSQSAGGFDLYSCTTGDLIGYTFFAKVPNDASNAPVTTLVGILNQ